MKRRSLSIATVIGFVCSTLVVSASTASAHPTVNAGPLTSPHRPRSRPVATTPPTCSVIRGTSANRATFRRT